MRDNGKLENIEEGGIKGPSLLKDLLELDDQWEMKILKFDEKKFSEYLLKNPDKEYKGSTPNEK